MGAAEFGIGGEPYGQCSAEVEFGPEPHRFLQQKAARETGTSCAPVPYVPRDFPSLLLDLLSLLHGPKAVRQKTQSNLLRLLERHIHPSSIPCGDTGTRWSRRCTKTAHEHGAEFGHAVANGTFRRASGCVVL